MCLILFAYRSVPGHPLVVAANRDEFHGRAAAPADYWSDHPQILAGRDLVAGGTWLGCTKTGRFAALTNFSTDQDPETPISRGSLVHSFLAGTEGAESYAHSIEGSAYAGFNLLLFDGTELVCTSNRGATEVLTPGFYGLSNAEFGARWPKCIDGAARLQSIVSSEHDTEHLIALLRDDDVPADERLPHRGRPIDMERRVSPIFIDGDEYGTRASTLIYLSQERVRFVEQSYQPHGQSNGRVAYEFDLEI